MTTCISINGVLGDAGSARISVLDRGFLYGDSVYEVIRTYRGSPFALDEHLHRLQRSADLLGFCPALAMEQLAREIQATVVAAHNPESYIRVIVTRGTGPINLDPASAKDPCRVVIVTEFTPHPAHLYSQGAKICLVPAGRLSGGAVPLGAKSGNYLVNIMALRVAREQGAHEAVMLDAEGRIAEGSSSNVFVLQGDLLRTPPLEVGILEGITRRKVIRLARQLGLEVREQVLRPQDMRAADEVFLTSTLREVLPVTRVDDWQVAQGQVGPVAQQLLQHFHGLAQTGELPALPEA